MLMLRPPTTWETRSPQYVAVCEWGIPNHALLQRLSAIDVPVFIANGDSDPMILPHYSHLLAGLIPQSDIRICEDSAHGFLFQHHAEFAADVAEFLEASGHHRRCRPRMRAFGSGAASLGGQTK
jgi:pimeloyl-ACP methyl ester carboxylesterase